MYLVCASWIWQKFYVYRSRKYVVIRVYAYTYLSDEYMRRRRKRKYWHIRFDKVLSIRDGKVDPLLRCICVGLHEASLVFRGGIAATKLSQTIVHSLTFISLRVSTLILEILSCMHNARYTFENRKKNVMIYFHIFKFERLVPWNRVKLVLICQM